MATQLTVVPKNKSESKDQSQAVGTIAGEQFIEKYAKGKNIEEVVKALFNGIKRYAGLKEFSKAEILREKLITVAPTAIEEIVKAAEIIEKEKSDSMDYEKIKPWAALFNQFTPGEATAFYFALKEFTARVHHKIFQQSECDSRIFFIESGLLKLSYYDSQLKKNVIFAQVRRGDVCGAEAFFTHTPHTTTLTVMEDSKINYIEKKDYQELITLYPNLESKLVSYCEKHQKRILVDNPKELVRRATPRFPTKVEGRVQRIDGKGNVSPEIMEMVLSDISVGGLCCKLKNIGIGDAATLHQSWVQVTLSYLKYSITHDVIKFSKVVSVRFLPLGECMLHLEFKTPLDEAKVIEIAKYTNIPTYI